MAPQQSQTEAMSPGRMRARAVPAAPLRPPLRRPPTRLRTSDRVVLHAARAWTETGGTMLDRDCGSGRILQHLRRAGRDAVGVEVPEELVASLDAAGLQLSSPTARAHDVDVEAPEVRAIAMAELLEHLDDAIGLLSTLRHRYPTSGLIASVPSPWWWPVLAGDGEPLDRPPKHLVRFSHEALRRLLARTGYRAEIVTPTSPAGTSCPTRTSDPPRPPGRVVPPGPRVVGRLTGRSTTSRSAPTTVASCGCRQPSQTV